MDSGTTVPAPTRKGCTPNDRPYSLPSSPDAGLVLLSPVPLRFGLPLCSPAHRTRFVPVPVQTFF